MQIWVILKKCFAQFHYMKRNQFDKSPNILLSGIKQVAKDSVNWGKKKYQVRLTCTVVYGYIPNLRINCNTR